MYSKINFVKINPTENMTILVKDKIPRAHQKEIANKLLNYNNVYAEQVGFIEEVQNPLAHSRLQMMGGEFCGNASLSLACLITRNENHPVGKSFQIPLECSGAIEILNCQVEVLHNGIKGKIKLPSPGKIEDKIINIGTHDYNFGLVHMPGILHLLVDTQKVGPQKDAFVKAVLEEMESLTKEEALGIMFYDEENHHIEPFVYVKTTGSKVWERGCGSGSAAVGAYLSRRTGQSVKLNISQPGGEITVYVENDNGNLKNIFIESVVKIVAEGTAYI